MPPTDHSLLIDIKGALVGLTTSMAYHEKEDQERHREVCRRLDVYDADKAGRVLRSRDWIKALVLLAVGALISIGCTAGAHALGVIH